MQQVAGGQLIGRLSGVDHTGVSCCRKVESANEKPPISLAGGGFSDVLL